MATYSDGKGYNLNSAAYPAHTQWRDGILEVVLKIADIVAARAAASLPALVAGDVLRAIPLPAQCLVIAVGVAIEKASAGALTVDVGDGTDPSGFVAALPANAVDNICSVGQAVAYTAGQYYPEADTIDVTLGAIVPVDGVIRVWAKVVDGAGPRPLGLVAEAQ